MGKTKRKLTKKFIMEGLSLTLSVLMLITSVNIPVVAAETSVQENTSSLTENGQQIYSGSDETTLTEGENLEGVEQTETEDISLSFDELRTSASGRTSLYVTPSIHSDTIYTSYFSKREIIFRNEGTETIENIYIKSWESTKGTNMAGEQVAPVYMVEFLNQYGYVSNIVGFDEEGETGISLEPSEELKGYVYITDYQTEPFELGTNLTTTITLGGDNFDDVSTTITMSVYNPDSPEITFGEYKYVQYNSSFYDYEFSRAVNRIDFGTVEVGTEDFYSMQEGYRRAFAIENTSKVIDVYTGDYPVISYEMEILDDDDSMFELPPNAIRGELKKGQRTQNIGINVNCSGKMPGYYTAKLHITTYPVNTTCNGMTGGEFYIPLTIKIEGGNNYYYSSMAVTGLQAEAGDGYIHLSWDPVGELGQSYTIFYRREDMIQYSKLETVNRNFYYDSTFENDVQVSFRVRANTTYGDEEKPMIVGWSDEVTVTPTASGKKMLYEPYLDRMYADETPGYALLSWNLHDSYDNGDGQERVIEVLGENKVWTQNTAVDYFYIVMDGKKMVDVNGKLIKISQSDFITQYRMDRIESLDVYTSIPWYHWEYNVPINDDYAHYFYVVPVTPDGQEGIPSEQQVYNEFDEEYYLNPLPPQEKEGTYYNISFNGNGGYAKTPVKQVKNGEKYGALSTAYRSGYILTGWYTASNGGTQILPEDTVNLTKDQTLYAHWESTKHTVTFNAMGGTVSKVNIEVINGEIYGELPTPTFAGRKFNGWYTESNGGTRVYDYTVTNLSENQTLYAHWLLMVNVTFNTGHNGVVSPASTQLVCGQAYGTLPTPARFDYINGTLIQFSFEGWYLEKEGQDPVKILPETIVTETTNHTLVAYWSSGASYTISFDGNGLEETIPDKEIDLGMPYGTLPDLTRTGYTFDGWYTAAEGGTKVTAATKTSIAENHTLYAHWSKTPYTLSFDAQGGSVNPASKTIYYDTAYGELPTPDKTYCIFLGWFSAAEGGTQISAQTILSSEANQTVYAHWAMKYTVDNPAPDVEAGEVKAGTKVNLTTQTVDAVIYYTTDPAIGLAVTDATGTVWEDSYTLDEAVTIYAIGTKEGFYSSDAVAFAYTIKDESALWGEVAEEDRAGISSPENIPSELWVSGVKDVDFTGHATTFPGMHVYWHKTRLTEGTDYTLKYIKNINAGKAEIAITGKGDYAGKYSLYFTIHPRNLGNGVTNNQKLILPKIYLANTGRVQKGTTYATYNVANPGEPDEYVVLKAGKDFKYVYDPADDYKSEGIHTVSIIGIGNYEGEAKFDEQIGTGNILVSSLKIDSIPAQEAKVGNEEVTPAITVRNGKNPIDASNFSVTYVNNTKPGTATAIVTGIAAPYVGSKTINFSIKALPIKKAVLTTALGTKNYDGTEQKQTGYVLTYQRDKKSPVETLTEGVHYTVKYSNAVNVGKKAAITFVGIGAYEGELTKNYEIKPATLTEAEVLLPVNNTSYAFQKGGTTPEVKVTASSGATLVKDKDYTVKYVNNKTVHDGTGLKAPYVTITGKGNYTGSITRYFAIEPSDLQNVKVQAGDIKYANKAGLCKPKITVTDTNGGKLAAGADYDKVNIEYNYVYDTTVKNNGQDVHRKGEDCAEGADPVNAKDIIPAGTLIRVTIHGINNYAGTEASTLFRYVTTDIAQTKATVADQIYTGSDITLSKDDFTISYKNVPLNKTDFEILSYTKNRNSGTATVTIKGVGNFGGTKTVNYKINKKNLPYTITFDANDAYMSQAKPYAPAATGKMKNLQAGGGTKLTAGAFKRNGYILSGWNTKADGSGAAYADKEEFTLKENIFAVLFFGSRVKLYAQWTPANQTITYVGAVNGKNGVTNTNVTTYTIEENVNFVEPERVGFTFGGWYADSKYKTPVTGITQGTCGNKSVYAKWIKN